MAWMHNFTSSHTVYSTDCMKDILLNVFLKCKHFKLVCLDRQLTQKEYCFEIRQSL